MSSLAIKGNCATDIARLQGTEMFFVPVTHDLIAAAGVVESYRVTNFMGKRIAQIVLLKIAIEANLPAP